MTTLVRRYAAVPKRTSSETWRAFANDISVPRVRPHLEAATNAAAFLIAESVTATMPIVLTGAGPRVHLLTVHGDDAVNSHNVDEAVIPNLSFTDDWALYLPDHPEDADLIADLVSGPHLRVGQPPPASDTGTASSVSRVGVIDLAALESQ